ncbi:hypothetical protein PVAP13_9KG467633 [Panicum virgatum]|uniref:Uncharacterized protein n=1 Tax=Panicum virgatum TaxID=38727 RepID=A0A8T0NZA5_PANVG|nr:hypothetical protein PVAP13_9KG467633 [Panicum virgatum]
MHHCHKIRLWSSVSSTRRQRSSGSTMWAPGLRAGGGDAAARGHRRGRWSAGPATRALELGCRGSRPPCARSRRCLCMGSPSCQSRRRRLTGRRGRRRGEATTSARCGEGRGVETRRPAGAGQQGRGERQWRWGQPAGDGRGRWHEPLETSKMRVAA